MMGVAKPYGSVNVLSTSPQGRPLADMLSEPGVVAYGSLSEAVAAGESIIQGDPKAVVPQADLATGTVSPPIPGGLQEQKRVVVTTSQPVPIPPLAKQQPPV